MPGGTRKGFKFVQAGKPVATGEWIVVGASLEQGVGLSVV